MHGANIVPCINSLFISVVAEEGFMNCGNSLVSVLLVDKYGDFDLACRDSLNVDSLAVESLKHL